MGEYLMPNTNSSSSRHYPIRLSPLTILLFAFSLQTMQGGIIANSDEENPARQFSATDWGYLFVLYVLLTAIRFFLFSSFYPLYSRIGLGSSWQEMVFQSYGGLRGAVGIALAISLDNTVREATAEYDLGPTYGKCGFFAVKENRDKITNICFHALSSNPRGPNDKIVR